MSSLIYRVTPLDWISLTTSTCVLSAVAGIAALFPVWHATQVDPITVLRAEQHRGAPASFGALGLTFAPPSSTAAAAWHHRRSRTPSRSVRSTRQHGVGSY